MDVARPAYVTGLDPLRFAAALGVALYHAAGAADVAAGRSPAGRGLTSYPEIAPVLWNGWVGVEVFFVISGFVIAQSAVGRTASEFLRHRVLRLHPGAWVCASLTLAAALLLRQGTLSVPTADPRALVAAWAASVTLWPFHVKIDGPYWTLTIEIGFYALVALALRTGAWRRPEPLLLGLAGLSTAFNLLAPRLAPDWLSEAQWEPWCQLLLLQNGAAFALGGFIWRVRRFGLDGPRLAGLGLGLVGAAAEIAFRAADNSEPGYAPGTRLWPLLIFGAATGLVAVAARWEGVVPAPARAAARRAGLATYPFYLLHATLGGYVLYATAPWVGRWAGLVVSFGAVLALSFAVLPAERWIAGRLRRRLFPGEAAARGSSSPVSVQVPP